MKNRKKPEIKTIRLSALWCLLVLLLGGCGSQEREELSYSCDAASGVCTPCHSKFAKKAYNKPYNALGSRYTPQPHYELSEIGIASYYGGTDVFHGRKTSNGEIFDMNRISAAHKTLPIPCVLRVTNLENGRAIKVKINDRGPFVEGRVIDVSRKVAQLLGFYHKGTAKVHVETVLPDTLMLVQGALDDETLQLAEVSTVPGAARLQTASLSPHPFPVKSTQGMKVRNSAERSPRMPSPFYQADRALLQKKIEEAIEREPVVGASSQRVSYAPSFKGNMRRSRSLPGSSVFAPVHQAKAGVPSPRLPHVLAGSRGYFVQAEMFRNSGAADAHYKKLQKALGRPSYVKLESTSFGQTKMFRVLVGPFRYADEAKSLVQHVFRAGKGKPVVIYNG